MLLPLVILTIISSSGLALYGFKKIPSRVLNLLIALGAGSMLAVSLVHILPEALEQTELAIYAFMAGFLLIYVIEELLTPHAHDHKHGEHSHEDPHEHFDHVALVSFIAIFVHTIFDGLAIRAGFGLSKEIGYIILAGVAIHQVPVSLSLAALFRESAFARRTQLFFLGIFALAAPAGFILSDLLIVGLGPVFAGIATAFAGGSLLYVSTADLLPIIHGQSHGKKVIMLLFLIGAIGMSAAKILE